MEDSFESAIVEFMRLGKKVLSCANLFVSLMHLLCGIIALHRLEI